MRVSDAMLKCVAFVGEGIKGADQDEYGDLCATGFFVSIPVGDPDIWHIVPPSFHYFVTAKHVAEELQGRPVYFLVNQVGSGVTHIVNVLSNWWLHPTDKSADVAVVRVGSQMNADVRTIDVGEFATPERLNELQIGIGDQTFAIGLFTPAAGTAKNIPIVRQGNIAMMAGEQQIQTELGYADVHLVEARSLGGLSGSPVFVRPTMRIQVPKLESGIDAALGPAPRHLLLGLMHGHWDIKESEINKPYFTHDRKHGVNYGIAIVVPAAKILETLNRDELREERMKIEKDAARGVRKNPVPGMDAAKADKKEVFTESDFDAALKKVTRRVKPD